MSHAPRFGCGRAVLGAWLAFGASFAGVSLAGPGCASSGPRPANGLVTLPALPENAPPQAAPATELVAELYGVSPSTVVASPSGRRLLLVQRIAGHGEKGDGHVLVMVAPDGRELGRYPAALPGLVGDVAFLGEDSASYIVLAVPRAGRAPEVSANAPHVVQPLVVDRVPRICRGRAFVFSPDRNHLLHVAGTPGSETVWLDGQQVYPARGTVAIVGSPSFSPDGRGVAWLEGGRRPRLVLLENLEGRLTDRHWDLPATTYTKDLPPQVFWQGAERLLVGPSMTRAVFETTRATATPLPLAGSS